MSLCALALTTTLFTAPPPPAAPPAPGRRAEVHWRDEEYEPDELPEDLPEGARDAIVYWEPWASEHDCNLFLTEDASVMVVEDGNRVPSREWKTIEQTIAHVNELAPLPPRGPSDTQTGTQEASADGGWSYSWSDLPALEYHTAAFFRLSGSDEFRSLLDYVAERENEPAGWAGARENLPGIILHDPLAGVVVDNAPGVEEWNPINEMVNRLARVMIARRFGNVPHWISLGVAWHTEMAIRDDIYCFPDRTSFVNVAEHSGWKNALRNAYRERGEPELDFAGLAGWERGTWNSEQAGHAFGVVSFAHDLDPGALGLVIEDLRLIAEEKGRITHDDGTWELIPGFEPSAADQVSVLRKRVHPDFLAAVSEYFRSGMSKPRR